MSTIKTVVLIILDGWGLAPAGPGNAISLAKTPNFNKLWAVYPKTKLVASGQAVGLPRGERGNSETGHLNLGAGAVIFQDLPRIDMSIADGGFFLNSAFKAAIDYVRHNNSALHLLGLLGAGGVHSSLEHLFALLHLVKSEKLNQVWLHLFTDGRDSPPTSAQIYLNRVQGEINKVGIGQIATLCGRYFAMDRDYRWERTQKAYDLIVGGKGKNFSSYTEAVKQSYIDGKTDEFLEPVILNNQGLVKDNDAVIFFNFRIDRPRQLTKAFVIPDFETMINKKPVFDPYAERYGLKQYQPPNGMTTFKRSRILKNIFFVSMTEYEKGLPVQVAFPPEAVPLPLARVLSEKSLRQFHLAETEKERFVTYYFNGQREDAFPGEDRIEIPSPNIATYDLKPEMSAYQLTDELIKKIKTGIYDFILVNFANPDMVGHTGVLSAGIKACEAVDQCLGPIVQTVANLDGTCVVTADHGNVEEMINVQTGEVDTEHSTNPVPFIVVNSKFAQSRGGQVLPQGILADVAPTILSLMGLEKPDQMTGRNLLQ